MIRRFLLLAYMGIAAQLPARAQTSPEKAYEKLQKLAKLFHGNTPFTCNAVTEVKYKKNGNHPLADTSKVIYRNKSTYYKSRRVERTEGNEGEITVNHEIRTVLFHLSDSVRLRLQQELDIKPDTALEKMLEKDVNGVELAQFKKILTTQYDAIWENKEDLEEIRFEPKKPNEAKLLSISIKFEGDRVYYYKYVYRDFYATDYYGKSQFRLITKTYKEFNYDNVPQIPTRPSDILTWNGWNIKLAKYKNYKLTVL